ncbi:MAG TPA: OmpA family protein [Thermoanaerobaculia bacterium]
MRPRKQTAFLLLFTCVLIAGGCRKKPPATAPDLVAPAADAPAAVTAPAPAPEPAPAPVPEPDPLDGDLASVNEYLRSRGLLVDVYFDYDRADLSSESRDQLARNARFLNEDGRFSLILEGHCDERGTVEYNLALGERRAQSAKSYLVSLGVAPSRLTTISYGEERQVCEETEESCWRLNRRAHPVVTGRAGD